MIRKTLCFTFLLILALLSACAAASEAPAENTPAPTATPVPTPDPAQQELIDMFGSSCVTEYTQQLTLDGFDGEVWFVPYRPFHSFVYAQIIQNGETLAQLNSRGHEGYGGEQFSGIDSVVFRDLNGDGKTDIVMIERFGDERFASLFFSAPGDTDAPEERFYRDDVLERALENRADFCSVPLTAEWAADMVHVGYDGSMEVSGWAGDFDDWRTAYRAAALWFEQSYKQGDYPAYYGSPVYSLIDVDGGDVPEVAATVGEGHLISIYTFRDGTLYMPARRWGFEYIPGENSVMHYADGILTNIWYYIGIGPDGDWRTTAVLRETYFADPNGNGVLDADEPADYDYTDKNGNGFIDEGEVRLTYWRDDEKISREEFESYGRDRYEIVQPELSFDEFMTLLDEYGTD